MYQILSCPNKDGNWAAVQTCETKPEAETQKEILRQTDKNAWFKVAKAATDNAPKPTAAPAPQNVAQPTAKKAEPNELASILERLATAEQKIEMLLPTIETPTIEAKKPIKTATTKKATTATRFKLSATGIVETEIICDEKDIPKHMKNLKAHAETLQLKIPYDQRTHKEVICGSRTVTQWFCDPSQHMRLTVQKL